MTRPGGVEGLVFKPPIDPTQAIRTDGAGNRQFSIVKSNDQLELLVEDLPPEEQILTLGDTSTTLPGTAGALARIFDNNDGDPRLVLAEIVARGNRILPENLKEE